VRTSHFLLIASFVMVAIGAAGLLLALARVGRVAGPRAGVILATAVGCVMAYVFSSHRSLYASQRLAVPKGRWTGPLGHALRDHKAQREQGRDPER